MRNASGRQMFIDGESPSLFFHHFIFFVFFFMKILLHILFYLNKAAYHMMSDGKIKNCIIIDKNYVH